MVSAQAWWEDRFTPETTDMSNVVAYLNFGALHLLHIAPVRPWIFAAFNDSEFTQPSADFNGFARLEEDMRREIECFSRAGVSLIVVQTPHVICDEVFGDEYKSTVPKSNFPG